MALTYAIPIIKSLTLLQRQLNALLTDINARFPGVLGVAPQGNAAVALTAGTDSTTQFFNITLTADRAVTLNTTSAVSGSKFRITRKATGAFNLNVGTGPLKALAAGQWCDVEYDGTAWQLTAFGSL